tara:strand:+ start:1155 stop:2030 length:876 start_codon:yes stop_codon:yes gene_type:complete
MSCPHTVFIIPYRNRPNEKKSLDEYFFRLKNDRKWSDDKVKFLYIHQVDDKLFNRGAMKNIGFIYIKNTYPKHYKDITLIFHDVDFYPDSTSLLPYKAKDGEVEHYYGFKYVLGGIFCIKGKDFEKIGGFPNYWGWGFEDNKIYLRCLESKLTINRDNFYDIYDKHFIYYDKGDKNDLVKTISDLEFNLFQSKVYGETFNDIKNLKITVVENIVNVTYFETGRMYTRTEFSRKNLRGTGGRVYVRKGWWRKNWSMNQLHVEKKNTRYNVKQPVLQKNNLVQSTMRRNWKLF